MTVITIQAPTAGVAKIIQAAKTKGAAFTNPWLVYEEAKRSLQTANLSPQAYDTAIRCLLSELNL